MNLDAELEAMGIPALQTPQGEPDRPAPQAVTDHVHPIAANWAKWKDRIADAVGGGFDTVAEIERAIFSNQAQLWCGKDAAVVTKIQTYPGGERVLMALWMAGDIEDAMAMASGIESFGRSMGCTSALIEGRKGWERLLRKHGYDPWSVTVRKAL